MLGGQKNALANTLTKQGVDGLMDSALATVLPRSADVGVRWVQPFRARGQSVHQHFLCVGVPDFLFYLELQVVIRRPTFASKKEINFFQVFHCTIYLRKETFS